MMKVSVKLYASLTKYAGGSVMHEPMQVELADEATLTELYDAIGIPDNEVKTAFVNSTMQTANYRLRDGDEVGVFPPVGGG
jgi:molybdopterin converting factor small subunit